MSAQAYSDIATAAAQRLAVVRAQRPLVHNITNHVVMNFSANVLLALGASPVMAHAPQEIPQIVAMSDSLVLNIGTLSASRADSMVMAADMAAKLGKPVVLDPVGAGATTMRITTAWRIIESNAVTAIRGNASEIMALNQEGVASRGMDSQHLASEAAHAARNLAIKLGCVVAVSGAVDLLTDGKRKLEVANGHEMLTRVTGTGCASSAVIGAFLALGGDPLTTAATAMAYFGLAGELAHDRAQSPGGFSVALIDSLYEITPLQLGQAVRIADCT